MFTAALGEVLPPALAALGIAITFFILLRRRSGGQMPWFELGGFYVVIVVLYTVLPTLSFLRREAIGGAPTDDARFAEFPAMGDEVAAIAWWHVIFLACFAVAYFFARGRVPSAQRVVHKPDGSTVQVLLIYFVMTQLALFVVGLYYSLNAETYSESYLIERDLPLIPKYVVFHCRLADATLKLLLLTAAFTNYRKYRWFILALLAYAVSNSFVALHSRTEMAMLLVASGILYHRNVRKLRPAAIAAWGVTSLFILLLFGIVRSDRTLGRSDIFFNMATSAGEFEAAMSNGVDLRRKRDLGLIEELSFHDAYLSPFTALIPQPLLPFQKFSHATWYMTTFYLPFYEQGGGLAFGAVPEALVANGVVDLIWRGTVLGIAFALIHRYYARKSKGFWRDAFYLWLLLFSYQAFRDTTFSLIYLSFHRFFVVYLIVTVFTRLVAPGKPSAVDALVPAKQAS